MNTHELPAGPSQREPREA